MKFLKLFGCNILILIFYAGNCLAQNNIVVFQSDFGSVSYTHLDVYKRQAAPAVVDNNSYTTNYTGSLSDANNNLPPNAEAGKCYARCFISDQYEFKEEMVVDKPVTYRTQSIPAQYKTVFDTVQTRAASIRYQEVPAVYETVTEDIMVSPATQKLSLIHI